MRIAWMTPFIPWPENSGGRIRVANFARSLGDHSLHLFSAIDGDDVPSKIPERWAPWSEVRLFPKRDIQPFLFAPLPFRVRAYPPELWSTICRMHESEPWNAIVVEHCYSGRDVHELNGATIILNEHNVESSYWRRMLASPHWTLIKSLQLLRIWRRFERSVWQSVDHVTAVSQSDASVIQSEREVKVFPNGVDFERFAFQLPSQRTSNAVLFVGLMSYEPNVQAAMFLAKRVMPLVRERIPNATLTIAGRDPLPSVLRLASDHTNVTGTVHDIASLFDQHAAYAMPLEIGAGTSLKVLEPLAAGIPLVASPFAVRGHGLEDTVHFRAARTVAEFADALTATLTQRSTFDTMALNARRIAETRSWKKISAEFAQWVTQIAQ
jgi:glycosyltransferase involved in cell wall biosynthesis